MSCCDDEDDEDILKTPPLSTSQTQTPTPISSSDDSVLSPMNSNFTALTCRDILRLIFERLDIPHLARACCICRVWNSVGSDKEVRSRAFRAPWRLKKVVGKPSNGSFWRYNRIGKFAISHKLNRGDSIASLAVKYSVQRKYRVTTSANTDRRFIFG